VTDSLEFLPSPEILIVFHPEWFGNVMVWDDSASAWQFQASTGVDKVEKGALGLSAGYPFLNPSSHQQSKSLDHDGPVKLELPLNKTSGT
jgi:hypothetical protein